LHRHLLDPWQDWRLGIDASGRHWPSELSLQGANAEQASEYIGRPTWVLSRALDRLGINPRDFVFVDLGSGKGRVILRAGARPFRRVEGVEFSEPLHRQAVGNIARAEALGHLRAPVIAHNIDAAKYDLPREKLVIYSFSPFGKKVMQQFADRLVASLRAHPRDCYFIHLNPQHPECLGGAFEPMAPSPRQATLDRLISPWPLRIYRYREAFGGAAA
jgi:hypothetical protein